MSFFVRFTFVITSSSPKLIFLFSQVPALDYFLEDKAFILVIERHFLLDCWLHEKLTINMIHSLPVFAFLHCLS